MINEDACTEKEKWYHRITDLVPHNIFLLTKKLEVLENNRNNNIEKREGYHIFPFLKKLKVPKNKKEKENKY